MEIKAVDRAVWLPVSLPVLEDLVEVVVVALVPAVDSVEVVTRAQARKAFLEEAGPEGPVDSVTPVSVRVWADRARADSVMAVPGRVSLAAVAVAVMVSQPVPDLPGLAAEVGDWDRQAAGPVHRNLAVAASKAVAVPAAAEADDTDSFFPRAEVRRGSEVISLLLFVGQIIASLLGSTTFVLLIF